MRYRLSYAEVSEWLAERGILVDQSTIYRWVQRFLSLFGVAARQYRQPVGLDWRVDETYARIRGRWHYICRAIDGTWSDRGCLASRPSVHGAWPRSTCRPADPAVAQLYPPTLALVVCARDGRASDEERRAAWHGCELLFDHLLDPAQPPQPTFPEASTRKLPPDETRWASAIRRTAPQVAGVLL